MNDMALFLLGLILLAWLTIWAMFAAAARIDDWQAGFDVDVWDDFDEEGARRSQAAHPSNQQGET